MPLRIDSTLGIPYPLPSVPALALWGACFSAGGVLPIPVSQRAAGKNVARPAENFVGNPNYFVGKTYVIFTPTVHSLKRNYLKNLFRSFVVILTDTYRATRGSPGPLREPELTPLQKVTVSDRK